jgi:two-component sensor histidine kinase
LTDLVKEHSDLSDAARERLQLLVGDWQLLSDLSFADLVLWVPRRDGQGHVAVAHGRPSTASTVYYEDMVGAMAPSRETHQIDLALAENRICREQDPYWAKDVPVREETIPVPVDGRPVAVLARHTNLASTRTPSRLEMTYLQSADALVRMVADGTFPDSAAPTGPRRGAPRVGDGLLRLDADGVVLYASPNGLANYHRLGLAGDLAGHDLAEVTTELIDQSSPVDESLPLVLTGRAPWRTEVSGRGVALSLRAIPLTEKGERAGAIILCRDVTELQRRELELVSKDATIREIHHRVKNNLQTVTALLRLQARRITSAEGREALEEAMRRVGTIALVHETLAHGIEESVDFDALVDRGIALTADLAAATPGARAVRTGSFGVVHAQDATPLALVLNELVTNAIEHGLRGSPGTVHMRVDRQDDELRVVVADRGAGLPEGFRPGSSGLGTQIVLAMVAGELRGRIRWTSPPEGGTEVVLEASLQPGSSSGPGVPGSAAAGPAPSG